MIKLAIVGTGKMAGTHAHHFQSIRGVEIVACCDIDLVKAREFAREYSIANIYYDLDDMLEKEELDAVANVTPDFLHYSLNIKILKKGLHLLCEKPLASNYKEARKLSQLAREQQVINMVNFIHRNSPALQKMTSLIQSGKVGNVLHVETSHLQSWVNSEYWGDWKEQESLLWRLAAQYSSQGIIGQEAVHLIDCLTFIIGPLRDLNYISRSFSKGVRGNKLKGVSLDTHDSAIFMLNFKNDAIGSMNISRVATGEKDTLRIAIYGDEGGLKLIIRHKEEAKLLICRGEDRHEATWKEVKLPDVKTTWQHFIACIRSGEPADPDFAHAAILQKTVEDATKPEED